MNNITEENRALFLNCVQHYHETYDEESHMVRQKFVPKGYHTHYQGETVHPTFDSMVYALALLDTGIEENYSRANNIIDRILSLQDTNPDNDTFGIWSWYLEEPLEKMAPPDWNWADFLGKVFLQIASDYPAILGTQRLKEVQQCISRCCRSILKRDVTINYTNIAVMDSVVAIFAGELLENTEFLQYGKEKIQRIWRHISTVGLNEYNSPTYTLIVLRDIAIALQYIKDKDAKENFRQLFDFCWKCVAEHFFYPAFEWAGPHGRAYEPLMTSDIKTYIKYAVGIPITEAALELFRTNLKCPSEYLHYFQQAQERCVKFDFKKENRSAPTRSGYCYMNDKFSLGTFFCNVMWNQNDNFIAHWGTEEKPFYLRLRFLHNDYDFCGVKCNAMQDMGKVLTVLNFAYDGGDTHPSLDKIENAVVRARDLRLRFEVGGDVEGIQQICPWENGIASFASGGLHFTMKNVATVMGDWQIRTEFHKEAGHLFFDIILYSGEEREIHLLEFERAFSILAFSIQEAVKPELEFAVQWKETNQLLHAEWSNLTVDTLARPAALDEIWENTAGYR